jgi:hypothetical protein
MWIAKEGFVWSLTESLCFVLAINKKEYVIEGFRRGRNFA